MKTTLLLTLGNIDFLFNYLNENGYRYGSSETTGAYSNKYIKNDTIKYLYNFVKRSDCGDSMTVTYLEIDDELKGYYLFTRFVHFSEYTYNFIKNYVKYNEYNRRTFLNDKKEREREPGDPLPTFT